MLGALLGLVAFIAINFDQQLVRQFAINLPDSQSPVLRLEHPAPFHNPIFTIRDSWTTEDRIDVLDPSKIVTIAPSFPPSATQSFQQELDRSLMDSVHDWLAAQACQVTLAKDWAMKQVLQIGDQARRSVQKLEDVLTIAQTELIIRKLEKLAKEHRIRDDVAWNVIDTSMRWTGESAIEQSERSTSWLMIQNPNALEIMCGASMHDFAFPDAATTAAERASKGLNYGKIIEYSKSAARWVLGELVAAKGRVTAPLAAREEDLRESMETVSGLDGRPLTDSPMATWEESGCQVCDF